MCVCVIERSLDVVKTKIKSGLKISALREASPSKIGEKFSSAMHNAKDELTQENEANIKISGTTFSAILNTFKSCIKSYITVKPNLSETPFLFITHIPATHRTPLLPPHALSSNLFQ